MATGKVENLKPWKQGQSGNPGGKAKGTRNRATIACQWLKAPATDGGDGEGADQITHALIQKAAKGDVPSTIPSLMLDVTEFRWTVKDAKTIDLPKEKAA